MKEMQTAPAPRRWTRAEYEQMIATGVIHSGERVELIDGEILTMAAQGGAHATGVYVAQKALAAVFGVGYQVRPQMPVALDDSSEPEPDLAVVPGQDRDYREHHPTTVLLVVEVSDTTLKGDRSDKASLYARNGIRDYWIINLVDRVLEVYRDPIPDTKMKLGWGYRLVQRFGPEDEVSPLAKPEARIRVADLLP